MNPLPQPLSTLFYASLSVSTTTLVFIPFVITVSPALWVLAVTFIITFPHHITSLLLARYEPHGSPRIYSALKIAWAFIISLLWTASFALIVIFTVLEGVKHLHHGDGLDTRTMIMIAPCVSSLIQCVLVWWIAILCRKERKRITYSAKWRPTASLTSSQQTWRYVDDVHHLPHETCC